MKEDVLNPNRWEYQIIERQLKDVDEKTEFTSSKMENCQTRISSFNLYKYLKVKFGPPNGMIMLLKNNTSDNLIHWHYSFTNSDDTSRICFLGKTSGLEILIKMPLGNTFDEEDWNILFDAIEKEIKKFPKEIQEIQDGFEEWTLFINPFTRVEEILQESITELEKLDLEDFSSKNLNTQDGVRAYTDKLEKWIGQISKAASLGTVIRMLSPVMAESFINLVIFVFRREEFLKDERLYESLIRQPIDIRVKMLHMNCTCFSKEIDCSSKAFKDFHTLMNKRNDFLHGNVDPYKMQVEKVWFDQYNIPLFEKDEGIIKKTMKNYCTNVERDTAIRDFDIVSNLIELILMSMKDEPANFFIQFMEDKMPGINNKTKRLGVLFSTKIMAEGFAY